MENVARPHAATREPTPQHAAGAVPSRSKNQFGLTRLAYKRAGEGLGMRYKQHAAGERLGDEDLAGEGPGT